MRCSTYRLLAVSSVLWAASASLGQAQQQANQVELVRPEPEGEAPPLMLGAGSDPALIGMLTRRMRDGHTLTLLRSERAMTDCRPVSLFSIQTARQLG